MPTYRQILLKAFNITFRNPGLWFFGFFGALLGAGGEINLLFQSSALGENQSLIMSFLSGLFEGGFFNPQSLLGSAKLMFSQPLVFLLSLFWFSLELFLVALMVWLVIVSQAALIRMIVDILKNKKGSWSESFKAGLNQFWPVFLANAVFKVITLSLMAWLAVLATWLVVNFTGLTPLFIIAFIILIWLLVVLAFVTKYLILFVVLKGQKIKNAVKEAWQLFYQNWLLSLEVAVILFFIYWVLNYCFAAVFQEFMVYTLVRRPEAFTQYLLFGLLIFAVMQMFLALFNWAVWTIVFQILTNKQLKFSSRLISRFKKTSG